MIDNVLYPIGSLPPPYEGPDNLINGGFPQVCISVPISPEDGDLKRGALLGKISDGPNKGKYKLAKADAKDGSSTPQCILAENYKAGTTSIVPVYLTGQFNTKSIILGDGLNIQDATSELRKLSIFLSPSISRTKP